MLCYDTRTREWSIGPKMNTFTYRKQHTCVSVKNKVYALGGTDYSALDSIEVLDLSLPRPSWRILPQRLKKKRIGCQAVVDPKNPNNIIVVGGSNYKGKYLRSCEVVSLQERQEEQTRTIPSLMTPRCGHAMVLVESRFLVVMGGSNKINEHLASVEVLDLDEDPEEQEWRSLPPMRTVRSRFAAFYSPRNHKIVVAGGVDDRNKVLDTMEEMEVKVELLPLPNGPRWQQLPGPPPFAEMPAGFMDAAHQTKIERWLEECDKQMAAFLSNVDEQDKEWPRQGRRMKRL